MGPPAKRRKTTTTAIPEIEFDDSARADYLSGFHKRKVERAKHAKESAKKKEREERIRDRADLRKRRKEEMEAHVKAVNAGIMGLTGPIDSSDESGEEWEGIDEVPVIDREDEYVDEEKYTTVTVEEVGITREGFTRPEDSDDEEDEVEKPKINDRVAASLVSKSTKEDSKEKAKNDKKIKLRKKRSFRYENKTDRSAARYKERGKNKARAEARKGETKKGKK